MTVEFTAQYATTVEDLTAAWAFVMEHIDRVGPDPAVKIKPIWQWDERDVEVHRVFEVVVSGMVEADGPDRAELAEQQVQALKAELQRAHDLEGELRRIIAVRDKQLDHG